MNVSLFEQLAPEEMEALNRWVKPTHYRQGEFIFMPGDPSDFVCFLHAGRVKLVYLDESGKRLTLTIVRVGELFGEMALMGEKRRKFLAEAMDDVELCIVLSKDLLRFVSEHQGLPLQLIRVIGSRMHELETRLQDLIFKDVPTRLARLLVRLEEDHGIFMSKGVLLDVEFTHRDIADLIGSTRETITVTLNDLARQGLLEKHDGRLVVVDEPRLREVAQLGAVLS